MLNTWRCSSSLKLMVLKNHSSGCYSQHSLISHPLCLPRFAFLNSSIVTQNVLTDQPCRHHQETALKWRVLRPYWIGIYIVTRSFLLGWLVLRNTFLLNLSSGHFLRDMVTDRKMEKGEEGREGREGRRRRRGEQRAESRRGGREEWVHVSLLEYSQYSSLFKTLWKINKILHVL